MPRTVARVQLRRWERGRFTKLDIFPGRVASDPKRALNLVQALTGIMCGQQRRNARFSSAMGRIGFAFGLSHPRRSHSERGLGCMDLRTYRSGRLVERTHMPRKEAFEGFMGIFDEVESVCNLERVWRASRSGFGICAAAVPTDDFNGWMICQPGGNRSSTTVWKQINDGAAFQINDNRAIAMTFPKGEIINPNNARWRWEGQNGTSNDAEQRCTNS